MYDGELLPDDPYADWAQAARESLQQLRREVCLSLSNLYREAGDYNRATAALAPLLVSDRADEIVHRDLMRSCALAGPRHDALRQYQACVDALASCLSERFVYNAAAQGIKVEALDFTLEGDIDLHGLLGLSDKMRPGYEGIRLTCHVKTDAPRDKVEALCEWALPSLLLWPQPVAR